MLGEEKNRNLHIFCPIGLKKWFLKRFKLSKNQITEGDWWDDFEITKHVSTSSETTLYNDKKITSTGTNNSLSSFFSLSTSSSVQKKLIVSCVPAQHSSRRGLFDGNKTLWAGWTIKSHYVSFYFSGLVHSFVVFFNLLFIKYF